MINIIKKLIHYLINLQLFKFKEKVKNNLLHYIQNIKTIIITIKLLYKL
jgi:hypothetical protein